jgi:hypothetical protein
MDGMHVQRRRRRMQYFLVGCVLALIFGLDYFLLMSAVQH